MARIADPKNSEWIVGPVRVVAGPKGYRVLWTEAGRQRERSATRLDRAKEIAVGEMQRLELTGGSGGGHRVAFGSLVQDVLNIGQSRWAPAWHSYQERLARLHILPQLGAIPHNQVTLSRLQGFLDGLQYVGANPYSFSYLDHCRKLLVRAVERGIDLQLYAPSTSPSKGLATPTTHNHHEDGSPDLDLIPTDGQVGQLIGLFADWNPMYGVMARVAAYTAVRWGELLGLTRHDIDLDANLITVRRNCQESADGFRFGKVSVKKGGPKPRTIIADEVSEALAEWIAELPEEVPAGQRILTVAPPSRLFYTRHGNPIMRSNNAARMRKVTAQVPGWPVGATWHTLRHYAITRWLNMGFEPRFVSEMAGHGRNPATTWNWYLGVDSGAVERHQSILRERMERMAS